MKKLILSAMLLFAVTSVSALDLYIDGDKVEVDRLEIWTKEVCENPTYDFYDTDQDGRFTFGGQEWCYDPCNSTELFLCD